jgi:hypothetical protein
MSDGQQLATGTARRDGTYPRFQQAEGPQARTLIPPPTQPNRPPRRQPQTAANVRGTREGQCPHIKAKTPLTRGHAVPEVGLEPGSRPCKHWEVPETSPFRPDPPPVRPSPKPKVCTLCTPSFCLFRLPQTGLLRRASGQGAIPLEHDEQGSGNEQAPNKHRPTLAGLLLESTSFMMVGSSSPNISWRNEQRPA